jgi:hypothetical protein
MVYESPRNLESQKADPNPANQSGQTIHESTPNQRDPQNDQSIHSYNKAIQSGQAEASANPVIERPELIYLSEVILINGHKVHYTRDGARYLKQHWQHIYNTADDKLTNKAEIKRMIDNYDLIIQLYANE